MTSHPHEECGTNKTCRLPKRGRSVAPTQTCSNKSWVFLPMSEGWSVISAETSHCYSKVWILWSFGMGKEESRVKSTRIISISNIWTINMYLFHTVCIVSISFELFAWLIPIKISCLIWKWSFSDMSWFYTNTEKVFLPVIFCYWTVNQLIKIKNMTMTFSFLITLPSLLIPQLFS